MFCLKTAARVRGLCVAMGRLPAQYRLLRVRLLRHYAGAQRPIITAPKRVTGEFSGIVIYRIDEGRIAESWGELDFAGLFEQLRRTLA